MIRDDIKAAQIAAMKAGEKDRLATIRMMMARIKDRDIELRTAATLPDDDGMIVELLQKMVKQRRESIAMYETGGRPEMAAAEAAEILVIEDYLPAQMSEAETAAAIDVIKAELGATGMKDMGKVMAELKSRHATTLDMSKASALVKAALAG
ncbi:MAG: GatB/YqeY domain-containing protein [Sphingopyxis sp.]